MGFSCRRYLVAADNTIYRLANSEFDRMLRNLACHRIPQFAGQRVRMADVIAELVAREPIAVVRKTFAMFTFDDKGRVDPTQLSKKQIALAEVALAPAVGALCPNETVATKRTRG